MHWLHEGSEGVMKPHPSMALLRHLTLTVPALGSVLRTSITMDPSAHSIWDPGFMSTGSFL